MTLVSGVRLGPYEILGSLGAGGMGEVYRARDSRLGRDVAIKVLPQHLSSNPEVRARFEREARTVSSFNHPNICTLFDVGREDGTDYLVMELVEGETLATRLQRGPLSAPELLRLGIQIADALDRAHRAGVIHRDLKPANIMITRSGAKLMDFGLSRATGLAGASGGPATQAALTQSPTVAQALTAEGTLLGTFQYMSPEQLEGKEADARSDVWALGCVLYEMATGRRAFEGRSQASLIAAILEREPAAIGEAPSGSPPSLGGPPQGLEWLVRHCLAKDPEERIQTAHDVKLQLQRIAEAAGLSAIAPTSSAAMSRLAVGPRTAERPAALAGWIAAGVLLVAGAAFVAGSWPKLTARPAAYRFHAATDMPGLADVTWPRVSPDGRSLLFQASDSTGVRRAWLLRLDETTPHPIPGTENLQRAYWSPDSREIAFVADDRILRVAVAGGTPVIVCPAPGGADLSWGARGQILMDGRPTDSLRIVPAGGGELRPASRINRADHETGSAWPHFLPDGQHFLFLGLHSGGAGDIRLGRIGSLDSKLIARSEGRAEWAPGGWVLFVRNGALVAQKLDLSAGRLTGQPITISGDVNIGEAAGNFSVSRAGVLAVVSGGGGDHTLAVVDRQGKSVLTTTVTGVIANPRFSPDGHRVLYERQFPNGTPLGDVYVFDLDRGSDTRLTFTDGWAVRVAWSPDGHRFAYTRSAHDGLPARVMLAPADGVGGSDSIAVGSKSMFVSQWTADGSRLVGYDDDPRPVAIRLDGGDRSVQPLMDTRAPTANAQISPDGRWVVASELDGSRFSVFIENLVGPTERWQVSGGEGGIKPFWTRNGHEVVYEVSGSRKLMAADVDTRNGFRAGTPHALFTLPLSPLGRDQGTWAPDANGERFVIVTPTRSDAGRSIEVITDFRVLVQRQ